MLTYMLEGSNPANPGSDLYVINNSFVNQRPNGATSVLIGSADAVPALIQNNISMAQAHSRTKVAQFSKAISPGTRNS
jgi:hypothetical protein